MRVALYRRVSSDRQADEGHSLLAQQTVLQEYAEQRGWEVVADYNDVLEGSTTDRPGLKQLLDAASDQNFELVLLVDADRLSRLEVVEWELLKSALRDAGVNLATPTQGVINLQDEDDEFVADLLNLLSRRETQKLGSRVSRVLRDLQRQGLWAKGKPPYGYRIVEPHVLEVSPEEAEIYRRMVESALDGKGYFTISAELNAEGIPSPMGKQWNDTQIRRILRNPFYRGLLREKTTGKVYPHDYPQLLSDDEWRRLKPRLAANTISHTAQAGPLTLLQHTTDLTHCALCGRPIYTTVQKLDSGTYAYYFCRSRQLAAANRQEHPCALPRFRTDEVDRKLEAQLQGLLQTNNPEQARQVLERRVRQEVQLLLPQLERDTAQLKQLDSHLEILHNKIQRYYAAFEAGSLAPDLLQSRVEYLHDQLHRAEVKRRSLAQQRLIVPELGQLVDWLLKIILDSGRLWEQASLEQKQQVLYRLCSRIRLQPDGSCQLQLLPREED